jgi:nucleoside-diphosphate kinase
MNKTKEEKTLVIMKPETLQRELLGLVIGRFERKGLKIIGLKMVQVDDVLVEEHYGHHKDKPFFSGLKKYIKSAPVVVMAIAGPHAISAVRLIVGPTASYEADAGSIRGDFSMSMQSNIVHASDSEENAGTEIARFFQKDELFDYVRPNSPFLHAEDHF